MQQSNEVVELEKIEPFGFEILTLGHPALRRKSEEVSIEALKTGGLSRFIKTLRSPLDRLLGVGVSAPQVGVNLQIIITKVPITITSRYLFCEESPLKIYVNPIYKTIDSEELAGIESCLSVPGYVGKISRSKTIEVQAFDENGKKFVENLSGWNARIFLHEYDHLKGMLYVDHLLVEGKICKNFYEEKVWKIIESEKRTNNDHIWIEKHGLK